jgi:DNA-binding response OmpR family regulator
MNSVLLDLSDVHEVVQSAPLVFLVEDSPADTYLVRQSLKKHLKEFELRTVDDGEKAVRFFEAADSDASLKPPALLILDLNLPKRSGYDVLRRMKASRFKNVPVVIVTSSDSSVDRAESARLGADAYFRKPADLDEFMRIGELVQRVLLK